MSYTEEKPATTKPFNGVSHKQKVLLLLAEHAVGAQFVLAVSGGVPVLMAKDELKSIVVDTIMDDGRVTYCASPPGRSIKFVVPPLYRAQELASKSYTVLRGRQKTA